LFWALFWRCFGVLAFWLLRRRDLIDFTSLFSFYIYLFILRLLTVVLAVIMIDLFISFWFAWWYYLVVGYK
jgi:hypothetical protein